MNSEIIDALAPQKKSNLELGFEWWEKKRLWFNLSVGASGLLAIFLTTLSFTFSDFVGMLFYGAFVNLLYSVGFLIEAVDAHYFKGKAKTYKYRMAFFLLGTVAVSFVTFIMAIMYFGFFAHVQIPII